MTNDLKYRKALAFTIKKAIDAIIIGAVVKIDRFRAKQIDGQLYTIDNDSGIWTKVSSKNIRLAIEEALALRDIDGFNKVEYDYTGVSFDLIDTFLKE